MSDFKKEDFVDNNGKLTTLGCLTFIFLVISSLQKSVKSFHDFIEKDPKDESM